MQKYKGNVGKMLISMFGNDNSFGLGVWVVYMSWVGLNLAEGSLVISSWFIFSSIGQTPSGIFADRHGYKTALVLGSILCFIGILMFAMAQGFYSLIIGISLLGFGSAMKEGADQALIYEGMKQDNTESDFKKKIGMLLFSTNTFQVIAAIIGGLLYAFSPRLPFYLEALVALLSIGACLLLVEPQRTTKNRTVLKQINDSIRYAFHKPRFSKIFLFSALIGSVAFMIFPYVQPLYKTLDIPEAYFGFIAASFFIFKGLGSWFADRLDKVFSIDKYLVLHAAVFGFFLVLMQHVTSIYYVLPVLAIFYFLRGLYAPTISTFINEKVPSDKRATMLSVNSQLLTVVSALSLFGLGVVADRFGLQQVFFVVSLVSLGFLILYVLSLRKVQMD